MNKHYELLAPAGDFPMLISAVKAGADAVYFGLKEFSMRQAAKNFSIKLCLPPARMLLPLAGRTTLHHH